MQKKTLNFWTLSCPKMLGAGMLVVGWCIKTVFFFFSNTMLPCLKGPQQTKQHVRDNRWEKQVYSRKAKMLGRPHQTKQHDRRIGDSKNKTVAAKLKATHFSSSSVFPPYVIIIFLSGIIFRGSH